jgi:putative flavoprotein involved in K+ transport
MDHVETIIVGGGQAGLATSYYLTQHGREHVVLEQAAQPAHVWRDERWDSFTLVTPNWAFKIPGAEYSGSDRDGFMSRDDVVSIFDQYVARFNLPVQCNTRVLSVEPMDGKCYRVQTSERTMQAMNVVIATSLEQLPKIPPCAASLSSAFTQLHSSRYRNPESLPPGAVLVVGTAQSGGQIAEELYQRGRNVFLSTGSAGRAPRRYRGKDIFEWLYLTGFFDLTPDQFPYPIEHFSPPHLTGANGGHSLSLHQFARDGVALLGHLRGASSDKVSLAPDLHENLAKADGFEQEASGMVDGYVQMSGLDAPEEELPQLRDGYDQPIIEEIDLNASGISTVIWATGFTFDFSLVKMPAFDKDGFPVQTSGVSSHDGLFFVGMPWMPSIKAGTLVGVGESAKHIADTIAEVGASRRQGTAMPVA